MSSTLEYDHNAVTEREMLEQIAAGIDGRQSSLRMTADSLAMLADLVRAMMARKPLDPPTARHDMSLPTDIELPADEDRGELAQLLDAAWQIYGGTNMPADFWHDFREGVRFVLHVRDVAAARQSRAITAKAAND